MVLQEDYDKLKQEHETLKAQAKGLDAANLKNQTALDAALQKHKDDAEAHSQKMEVMRNEFTRLHDDVVAGLNKQREEALAALKQQHAAHVEQLKRDHLMPALIDLQKRQAADLVKAHQEQLDALKAG